MIVRGSNKNDYMTPDWFIDLVERVAPIGLDPCASANEEYHFAVANWSGAGGDGNDGLTLGWYLKGQGLVFVNPPYGKGEDKKGLLLPWCEKAVYEARRGSEVILLLPGYLERAWWQEVLCPAFDSVCYLNRRLNFMEWSGTKSKHGQGWFPSVAVYLGDRAKVFERAFEGQGFFIRPVGR